MINSVDSAIRRVRMSIPAFVLEAAFGTARNIEFYLRENVLYDVVQKDVSLYGGRIEDVLLQDHWVVNDENSPHSVIRIPPTAVGGQDIIDFLEIVYKAYSPQQGVSLPQINGYAPTPHGQLQAAGDSYAMKVFGNNMYVPDSPKCRLREGVLTVSPQIRFTTETYARVRVGFDSELSNMTSVSIIPFIAVFVLATKMMCWNYLIDKGLKLDSRVYELISDWNPEQLMEQYNEALVKFINSSNYDPDHAVAMWTAQFG